MSAIPSNTAVVGISTWDCVPDTVKLYFESASRMGIKPTLFKFKKWKGWYESKVVELLAAIRQLPQEAEYILYTDVRDALFVSPLDHICDIFNGFACPVVIAAETFCWPCRDPRWIDRIPKPSSWGNNYPQAGAWMGERSALEALMASFRPTNPFPNDDQYCWQLASLENRDIVLDSDCHLFCTVHNMPEEVISFSPVTRLVTVAGNNPAILHFPGPGIVNMRPVFDWIYYT